MYQLTFSIFNRPQLVKLAKLALALMPHNKTDASQGTQHNSLRASRNKTKENKCTLVMYLVQRNDSFLEEQTRIARIAFYMCILFCYG